MPTYDREMETVQHHTRNMKQNYEIIEVVQCKNPETVAKRISSAKIISTEVVQINPKQNETISNGIVKHKDESSAKITNNVVKVATIWTHGPDAIKPATSYTANTLNGTVKLRIEPDDADRPISIYSVFKNTVDTNPNHPALAFKLDGNWLQISYIEYWKTCMKAAKSFIKLGLELDTSVAILGFNSPQWFISFLGAICAGGIGCGIYTTNTSEACEFILNDSDSRIVVVENKAQLDKILPLRNKCNIKSIIQYTGPVNDDCNGLVKSWTDFIDYGDSVDDAELDFRVKTIAPNKCASLIYTSGTTGSPKAAMISHDNITYISRYLGVDLADLKFYKERIISYLPLSHIAAQVIDIHLALVIGGTVYFAQPDALKGSLVITMNEVKPTFFFGVPRVWEKMQDKIEKIINEQHGLKLSLFNWARKQASQKVYSTFHGEDSGNSASYSLAKKLILNKIKNALGLTECVNMYSGAAPTRKDTLEFFISLGLPLCEVFGMSELTGPHICGFKYANRVTSVGYCRNIRNQSRLLNKDSDGSGELCVYGRHVFMGYLNSQEKTNETMDPEGWLRTGDLAKIDVDGYLYITGRIKEIVITAGGENIAPVPIEDSIKEQLPNLISNVMLIGDKRKYLSVLLTLKSKINTDTLEPLDDLLDECVQYLKSIGSNSTKVSQIINNQDKKVYEAIDKGIRKANDKSISRAAKAQKFFILPRDFSIANGELGPTLKLRRPIVAKMYSDIIENLYNDDNANE